MENIMTFDPGPIFLTLKLAFVTTAVLLVIGVPLAYWLAYTRRWFSCLIEPLVSMPLVLPPTVLGFYLLVLFSPQSTLGHFLETHFHIRVVFTFLGLVIGSVILSLPFMVNPVKAGFEAIPTSLIESAYTLGKSKRETFTRVLIPNNLPAILTGAVMSFAHTIGEFGVVLMVGGNIPRKTRVVSMAIYSEVEALNYPAAHFYSIFLVILAFAIIFALNIFNKRRVRTFIS